MCFNNEIVREVLHSDHLDCLETVSFFSSQEYLVISLLVSILCVTLAWENRGHRRCVLDSSNKQYSFYENGQLTYAGAFNNVYIRLKEQKYGSGSVYYYVVFNGYHMHEQKITSYTTNRKRLRSLARKLAASLNLNYFDSRIYSKDHILSYLYQAKYTNARVVIRLNLGFFRSAFGLFRQYFVIIDI
ncbi:uncharacterized protein LOC114523251 [Dendronephthya gigantea]|uniref:uncharacterized protein LOC114523251 n=1 Tax=Dendronephthya gigantea TaxID=151771 RepID=UPI00106A1F3B|nr:uncharacterized protein LOC114523251 [Dendronephthya gigantea]